MKKFEEKQLRLCGLYEHHAVSAVRSEVSCLCKRKHAEIIIGTQLLLSLSSFFICFFFIAHHLVLLNFCSIQDHKDSYMLHN